MIDHTLPRYVFIRTCILALRAIAPASTLYCGALIVFPYLRSTAFLPLTICAVLETGFCFLVYLPRKLYLQSEANHPPRLSRAVRQELFYKCQENIPDPDWYISKWFLDAPKEEIRRENVKEFLRWSFLNSGDLDPSDEQELEHYVDETEKLLGRDLPAGRGDAKALRVTLDRVDMIHRPLLWYGIVKIVDDLTAAHFILNGFRFYRQPLSRFFTVYPPRPFHALSKYRSPAKHLSYWYRPHTSKTRLPVLFIHGIGIGLHPYVKFLAEINQDDNNSSGDGDIGIIAIELMPISFRITTEPIPKDIMCEQINTILNLHNWTRFVLVPHSYGSTITTHLLKDPTVAPKIGPILMIDPITFLLHLPDVAYNFTARRPARANEHQLYYFASKDMSVAHTLHRHFFWSQNILWREDLAGDHRRVTVSLGGRDLIVDTETVGAYLNTDEGWVERAEWGGDASWKQGRWTGKRGLETLWFEDCDHAQVFEKREARARLLKVLREYCNDAGEDVQEERGDARGSPSYGTM